MSINDVTFFFEGGGLRRKKMGKVMGEVVSRLSSKNDTTHHAGRSE